LVVKWHQRMKKLPQCSVRLTNVVARRPPMTYGQYAAAIEHPPARYGLAVGKAMHAIGALCVVRQLPVAPLYWVQRADGEHRGVFEQDAIERQYIVES